jgi:hypothetical protein
VNWSLARAKLTWFGLIDDGCPFVTTRDSGTKPLSRPRGQSKGGRDTAVESHISRKTSEMWGTRRLVAGIEFRSFFWL